MNVMAIEDSPIYESIISELGNPVPAAPIDCSYEAMLALAAAPVAEPVSIVAPGKRPVGRVSAPKLMAGATRDAG